MNIYSYCVDSNANSNSNSSGKGETEAEAEEEIAEEDTVWCWAISQLVYQFVFF